MDSRWHVVEGDLDKDLYDMTGAHVEEVGVFIVRGNVWLDEIERRNIE